VSMMFGQLARHDIRRLAKPRAWEVIGPNGERLTTPTTRPRRRDRGPLCRLPRLFWPRRG
jgi:hypothetical protein